MGQSRTTPGTIRAALVGQRLGPTRRPAKNLSLSGTTGEPALTPTQAGIPLSPQARAGLDDCLSAEYARS